MTRRAMNLRVFERKEIPEIFFQPRIEWWYWYNRDRGTLPERYREMGMLDLFDDLKVSIRYIDYFTGLPGATEVRYSDKVKVKEKVKEKVEGDSKFIIAETAKGELVTEQRMSSEGQWRIVKYPIENGDDVEKAIALFENTRSVFIEENFERGGAFFGERAEPQFFVPRSGYQHLALYGMGVENLIYAMADVPQKVERLMEAIDRSYDALYEGIISYGKVRIVNFGENIDGHIVSPRYFEKYCIPFYEKRSEQLRRAGVHTHIHIDGSFKPLLKYLKNLPFDGLEALTPFPQGDVSLEEMKEAIGDKILLDGIPAILFLPDRPMEELEECVEKIVKLFYPRLILGVSDEVPPPGDIERVRYISQYCRNYLKKTPLPPS